MPYYRVMLQGTGIRIPGTNSGPEMVGFYTTLLARAESEAEATRNACKQVEDQWATGKYAESNLGTSPHLSVEWVRRTTCLDVLFFKATGHTFYGTEEEGAA